MADEQATERPRGRPGRTRTWAGRGALIVGLLCAWGAGRFDRVMAGDVGGTPDLVTVLAGFLLGTIPGALLGAIAGAVVRAVAAPDARERQGPRAD